MRRTKVGLILAIFILLVLSAPGVLGASASPVSGGASSGAWSSLNAAASRSASSRVTTPLDLGGSFNGTSSESAGTVASSDNPLGGTSGQLASARGLLSGQLDGSTKWLAAMMAVSLLVVGIGFAVQQSARKLDQE